MLVIKEAFEEKQIEQIRQLYEAAFPANEKKPFHLILEKRAIGLVEIFTIEDEKKRFRGLIITILHKDMVLIDYFAIDEAYREIGIGSDVLRLFTSKYAQKRVFLEIESTISEQVEDYEIKKRRKGFYERNGLAPMNYLINLFDVEMEIMTFKCEVSFEEYHEMLVYVYGKKMHKKVQFIRNV